MTKKLFALLFGLVIFSIASLTFACNSDSECGANGKCNTLTYQCGCQENYKKVDGKCVSCSAPGVCCGVKLNTNVPFIGDCIVLGAKDSKSEITEENAFPMLVAGLTKLLMTVILIVCFLVLIAAGVLRTTGNAKKGKELITGVAIALALLGASGVILRLVNPNFFG